MMYAITVDDFPVNIVAAKVSSFRKLPHEREMNGELKVKSKSSQSEFCDQGGPVT